MARADALGELCWGESEFGSPRDYESGDPLVRRQTLLRSPVFRGTGHDASMHQWSWPGLGDLVCPGFRGVGLLESMLLRVL